MHILALNCGSSSIKTVLIDTDAQTRLVEMRVENLGSVDCRLVMGNEATALGESGSTAEAAIPRLFEALRSKLSADVTIEAVAHRIVHGGPKFTQPVKLDEQV